MLIQLYGCTTSTLTKRLKKLDVNYSRMLSAVLNNSWKQHPTYQQLIGNLPFITQILKIRLGTYASNVLQWTHAYGHTCVS